MRIPWEAAAFGLLSFWPLSTADAQDLDGKVFQKQEPGLKCVRILTVSDSLEADMMGLLARAEQGRVKAIRGEYYVPNKMELLGKEGGEEELKKLQSRLTGASFKLKLGEARTWKNINEAISREIGDYLTTTKKYRIVAGNDTTLGNGCLTISACLRLTDTVYVWTPGCNCPKPKSSVLATCAVVLEAVAVDPEKKPAWENNKVLFYLGLEESLEEALSTKRLKKHVREVFGSFK